MTDNNFIHAQMQAAKTVFVALVAALFFLCSPGVRAAVPDQDSILIQGKHRTFIVYTPDEGAGTSTLPIVMALHGGFGNGHYVAYQSGLANYVDRTKFIAVFPDAKTDQWNDGRSETSSQWDDLAFLREVTATVIQKWGGDPARVFVVGISSGGMMAQRMGCEASDMVTAIGAVVANLPADLVDRCHPSRPVPMVLFNGTADPLMPWAGGAIASSLGGAGGQVVSAMDTFNFWARFDGCGQPTVDNLSGTRVTRYTSATCRSGSEVTLYQIEGGGHGWPGGAPMGPIESNIAGYVTNEISATAIIIRFFHRYGL